MLGKAKGMRAYLRSLTPMDQVGCFELFSVSCPTGTRHGNRRLKQASFRSAGTD
jgi:hypothetical protein